MPITQLQIDDKMWCLPSFETHKVVFVSEDEAHLDNGKKLSRYSANKSFKIIGSYSDHCYLYDESAKRILDNHSLVDKVNQYFIDLVSAPFTEKLAIYNRLKSVK